MGWRATPRSIKKLITKKEMEDYFNPAQVSAILDHAAIREANIRDSFSLSDLQKIASDAGISPEALELAINAVKQDDSLMTVESEHLSSQITPSDLPPWLAYINLLATVAVTLTYLILVVPHFGWIAEQVRQHVLGSSISSVQSPSINLIRQIFVAWGQFCVFGILFCIPGVLSTGLVKLISLIAGKMTATRSRGKPT
jgi:hypothetical protein